MKHLRLFRLATAIMMTAVAGTKAQTASPRPGTAAPGVTYSFGFATAGTLMSAKPGAPFSAVLVEKMEQTLNDGTNIDRDNEEVVMRDGKGRIYRGRRMRRAAGNESEPGMVVTITDPVQHLQYLCTPVRKVCTSMEYRQPPSRSRRFSGIQKGKDVTVEDLGSATISGVEADGKRVTRVIPEGMVGNDRPFTTVEELWHSKELDVDVQVKRTDPRMGTRTTTMTEVSLGEPDPRCFQVPEGYRVEVRKPPTTALAPLPPTD